MARIDVKMCVAVVVLETGNLRGLNSTRPRRTYWTNTSGGMLGSPHFCRLV